MNDPILNAIVKTLKNKYRCHTIILYGSRARGSVSPTSDYDVAGISKRGHTMRLAKKQAGFYWDVFIYAEKDLRRLGDQQRTWADARLIHSEGTYGPRLLRRLRKLVAQPHQPAPAYEIAVMKVWAQKEFDRCKVGDVQAFYRRAELQTSLVGDYFVVRKRRYPGPKAGLAWLETSDPRTFKLIRRSLRHPANLDFLRAATSAVYRVVIK